MTVHQGREYRVTTYEPHLLAGRDYFIQRMGTGFILLCATEEQAREFVWWLEAGCDAQYALMRAIDDSEAQLADQN